MTKNSKIYIAGHRGLVGSAIVRKLKSEGYDNLILKTHKELDLLNQVAVADFFAKEKPEYVILAAAKVGGIVANNSYRADFIYENLQIQNNVIHQSYVHKVKKLLFLGSTCIYPKEAPQPMSEECLLTSPLEYTNEPYAIAKIAGIKMCESYNIQYNTNFISVMPTNLYGPNDNFDLEKSHVLPALLRKIHLGKCLEEGNVEEVKKDLLGTQAVIGNESLVISEESNEEEMLKVLTYYGIQYTNNQNTNIQETNTLIANNQSTKPSVSIEIWGSGDPRREFLHSDDMADACVFLMENHNFNDITNTPITNTHINIGTGKDLSIKELAELISKVVGYKGKLYFNTHKPDGTMIKLTNPSKLNSLGWKYSIELEDGLREVYEKYVSLN